MAHTGLAALLFFLGLVVSTDAQCEILNAEASNSNSSAFNLSVSPDTLSMNTTVHTVTLTGADNHTVILQALMGSTTVGNWSESNQNCSGSPLFQNQSMIQATWTSPENLTSVNISAHIQQQDNTTFIVMKQLNQAQSPDVGPTTNSTTANGTQSTASTVQPPTTTKSVASSVQTSLTTVAFLGLLTVISKYLS